MTGKVTGTTPRSNGVGVDEVDNLIVDTEDTSKHTQASLLFVNKKGGSSSTILSNMDEFVGGGQWLAHLACLSVQTLFSGWNIIGSLALNYRGSGDQATPSPLAFTLVRQIGAAAVMCSIAVGNGSKLVPRPQDYVRVIVFGLAGGCGMPVFFLYGLQLTTPTVCAIYDG
jgi:hypothetical protein